MMVVEMLKALVRRGHSCEVYLSRYHIAQEPYWHEGIHVFPREYKDDGRAVWRSDVVLSHLENVPGAAVAALSAAKPFVHVVHNTHPTTKTYLHGQTDLIVYNSEWMADECGRRPNAIIVRPPVHADDYRTTPGDSVTLVNLCADKGGAVFWRLAEEMPDVPFLGVQGAYGRQQEGDLPNVEILRHGADMREVYGRTRILLMPSHYESWGRVGIEAAASGIPTIAHPTPGLREALGKAGIFASRDYLGAWVREIRKLMQPAPYAAASKRSLARSAQLDPTTDLNRWCDAVEALAS
jgi:glycosyltransferase involved in cell wall biosynthesis